LVSGGSGSYIMGNVTDGVVQRWPLLCDTNTLHTTTRLGRAGELTVHATNKWSKLMVFIAILIATLLALLKWYNTGIT